MRKMSVPYAFPAILSGLFVGISTSNAYAYLDAGTGSMILQVLLGGVAGMMVVGKLYWHKLLVALRIRSSGDLNDDASDPAGSNVVSRDDR